MAGKLTVNCLDWKPLRKNTLQGFASVTIVELDLAIRDIAIHTKGDRTWAQLPSRPWIEGDRLVRDNAGKVKYSALIEFTRPETRNAFSARVVEAIAAAYPGALALEEASS